MIPPTLYVFISQSVSFEQFCLDRADAFRRVSTLASAEGYLMVLYLERRRRYTISHRRVTSRVDKRYVV